MQAFPGSTTKTPVAGVFVYKRWLPGGWMFAAALVALFTLVPIAVVLYSLLTPER